MRSCEKSIKFSMNGKAYNVTWMWMIECMNICVKVVQKMVIL